MHELRLLFAPIENGSFRVHLEDGPGQTVGVPATLDSFLKEDDFEDLRWYLEDYMDLPDGGAVVRAKRVEKQIQEWGRKLHDSVFTAPENAAQLKALLDAPEPRALTVATDQSVLLRLPWELLRDDSGSLAQRLAVRRQLEAPEELVPRAVKLPLRMLYIVSRPADTGFIDPRLTTRAVFAAIDPLQGSIRLDFCRPPTLPQMETMLRDAQAAGDPYDVVHFDGHGTFLPGLQLGALCFEKPDDGTGASRTDLVGADRLGDLLAQYKIPLVVLEACRSATVGKAAVFRSVAPRLIRAGVGSVVSMGHAVHVEAARILLDRFYRELARGATVGHAVAQGRSALVSSPYRWIETGPQGRSITLQDWFLPHLYQRGLDEPLLPSNAAPRERVRHYDLFLSHSHNDSGRVENLARDLSEKQGLRVWLDKWELEPGLALPQFETGIRNSRFTVVAGSQSAVSSKWVDWEIEKHREFNPDGDRLLPVKFEAFELPEDLGQLFWVDFTDPARDAASSGHLAGLIRTADADDARRRRGFRSPPDHGQPGAFPRAPRFGFHGRARELYELERAFRTHRGIVLHAMGGMGKTSLATEAAFWWTRSGLFRDGACFVSFEQFASAERVISVFGEYCEGPRFHQRPASEQRRRAVEFFRDRAVLLVWDNFESVLPQFNKDANQAGSPYTDTVRRELTDLFGDLTGGDGLGRVLVTCRPGETGLPGARRFELEGLARADSLWLLHRILERDGLTLADPRLARDKLDPLLDDLADHPLALELVGPHLRTITPEQIRVDFGELVKSMTQESEEERNTSLLASLEFSRRHLSPPARDALPWLGRFRGGVFEQVFLDVSQIDPAVWEPIRTELQGIALVRTEDDIIIRDRPFLRFHPTLAIASADSTLAAKPETRERFVQVYLKLMGELHEELFGSQSRRALEILDREEMNWRTAVRWAIAGGRHEIAADLGYLFLHYLRMSARLRERSSWVGMLRDAVAQAGFSEDFAFFEQEYAWTLYTQGDPEGAIEKLQALIDRLHQTTEFDPAFQLAKATLSLGRVLYRSRASAQAIPVLREAVDLWGQLVERAGVQCWRRLLERPDHVEVATELRGLSAGMGSLANALSMAGQHEEALKLAENGLTISERLGDHRNVAAGHSRWAEILMRMDRFDEADARCDLALDAARQVRDECLEGGLLQHQGGLAVERNQLERAARLYQQALQLSQQAGDDGSIMRLYNLLGVVEQKAGRLAEARAWYEKSREFAIQLKNQRGLGATAENIGTVCQREGEAASERGDEAAARRHFEEARRFLEESLRIRRALGNKPKEAVSLRQLAQIHLLLGDLAAAERHAHEALQIDESLGLKEARVDYDTLSEIVAARGDSAPAAEWARKRDELLAELQRRARSKGSPASSTNT
jgi:tetratricopeptide (TPR) repeat protein